MPEDRFPGGFPEGCPPSDATEANGVVFRIVKDREVGEGDFRTFEELGRFLNGCPCKRRAVSVFNSEPNVRHHMEMFPKLGNLIARGSLRGEDGKVSPPTDATGHISWWPYRDVARHASFEVL